MKFEYPHPLINQGAGRTKSDSQNEKRIQKVLDRYEQFSAKNGNLYFNDFHVTKQQAKKAKLLYPAAFGIAGLLGSLSFVHKNSKYIGKCFILGTTALGYMFAVRYQKCHNFFRYFHNFQHYPEDIKKMIDNNDARYAYRWLKDDYLQNSI